MIKLHMSKNLPSLKKLINVELGPLLCFWQLVCAYHLHSLMDIKLFGHYTEVIDAEICSVRGYDEF